MTGIKLVVPAAFTDTTLPKLRLDPVLPDAGALLLLEPNHPSAPLTAPITGGMVLTNLAYSQAKAMHPAGTTSSLSAIVDIGPLFLGALGFVERSGKGGLHFAIGTTNDSPSTRYARLNGNADLIAYINANPTHSYYHSSWAYITRNTSPASVGGTPWGNVGASFQLPYFYLRPTGNAPGEPVYPIDSRRTGVRTYGAIGAGSMGGNNTNKNDGPGPVFWGASVANFTTPALGANGIQWNRCVPGATTPTLQPYGTSTIFYRSYVEDLTVSGRSYAQVDALDWAEFTKQVLTAGGRYYGDTYTAPPA